MGLTNTESVSKHKVQFCWPRKLRILCTLCLGGPAKCRVTWYGHSYLSLPPVIDWPELEYYYQVLQNLHFLLHSTRLQDWSHTEPMPFLSRCKPSLCLWAILLGLFHCSLTVTTIVKLCVTILRRAGSAGCHVSPPRLLSGDWAQGSWLWLPHDRCRLLSPLRDH